jgi:hypothetical protein
MQLGPLVAGLYELPNFTIGNETPKTRDQTRVGSEQKKLSIPEASALSTRIWWDI